MSRNTKSKDVNESLQKAFLEHLTNTTSLFLNSLRNPVKLEKGETSGTEDSESKGDVEALRTEKTCKEEKFDEDDVVSLRDDINVLTAKLRESNEELKEARDAFITGLENLLPSSCEIRVKQMGEIDDKPFLDAYAGKYADEPHKIVKYAASTLSHWQSKIYDSRWHPFSVSTEAGEPKEVLNENDATLKRLRRNHGKDVYSAVVQAMKEMNEYNLSGRYVVEELWNKTQNRKASLKEVINHVVTMIGLPDEPPHKKPKARPCERR